MSINLGLLLSQLGLALAVGGQALEHRQASAGERRLFDLRGLAALLLLLGIIAGFAARALAQGAPGQAICGAPRTLLPHKRPSRK